MRDVWLRATVLDDASPHRQLAFPGWDAPLARAHSETLHGTTDVVLALRTADRRVQLALEVCSRHREGDFWHRSGRFEVTLDFAETARCLVNGEQAPWNLDADDEHDGPFSQAAAWAIEQLEPDRHRYDDESVAREERARAALSRASRWAANWAIASCVSSARDLALRFAPDARMFVYAGIVADTTGRIAQMVEACPGVLIRAAAMHEQSAAQMLVGVRAGVPLRRLLDDAVKAVLPDTCRRAAGMFVRRVPASVAERVLVSALASPGLDINDLPRSVDDRHIWYEWQAESVRVQRRFFHGDRARFGSFVSKHALALDAIAKWRMDTRATLLAEIVDWARSDEGTVPTRRSRPEQVVEAMHVWHDQLWTRRNVDRKRVLPESPVASEDLDGVLIEPIRTVGELFDEGAAMRHCVASYADDVLDGCVHIYRGNVRGQRVTIAIERAGDRWRLIEATGFANRPTSTIGVIQQWMALL